MTAIFRTALIALAGLLAIAGCDSSTSPAALLSVVGIWSGTIVDNFVGAGTSTITIAHTGAAVTGNWATTFPDAANSAAGSLTGSVSGNTATTAHIPNQPTQTCPFNTTSTVSGTQWTGTYVVSICSPAAAGSVSMSKQGTGSARAD